MLKRLLDLTAATTVLVIPSPVYAIVNPLLKEYSASGVNCS